MAIGASQFMNSQVPRVSTLRVRESIRRAISVIYMYPTCIVQTIHIPKG